MHAQCLLFLSPICQSTRHDGSLFIDVSRCSRRVCRNGCAICNFFNFTPRCRNAARERIDGSIGDRKFTSTSSTYVATLSLCFSVPSDCCTMALRNTMDRPLNFSDRIKDRSVGERTIITIERDSIEFLFPDGFYIFLDSNDVT